MLDKFFKNTYAKNSNIEIVGENTKMREKLNHQEIPLKVEQEIQELENQSVENNVKEIERDNDAGKIRIESIIILQLGWKLINGKKTRW